MSVRLPCRTVVHLCALRWDKQMEAYCEVQTGRSSKNAFWQTPTDHWFSISHDKYISQSAGDEECTWERQQINVAVQTYCKYVGAAPFPPWEHGRPASVLFQLCCDVEHLAAREQSNWCRRTQGQHNCVWRRQCCTHRHSYCRSHKWRGKKKKKKKSDDFISRSRLLRRQESIQNSAARMAMTLIWCFTRAHISVNNLKRVKSPQ